MGMEQSSLSPVPALTHVPFEENGIKLTSFAQSIMSGTIRIGNEYSKGNARLILFFNDFRNPQTGYCVSCEQAANATRFILADHLRKLIKQEEENLDDLEQLSSANDYHLRIGPIEHTKNRIKDHKERLTILNVSEALHSPSMTNDYLTNEAETMQIKATDSEEEREFKRGQIIEILKKMKEEPDALRAITCERFYRFWRCEDLESNTPNDARRDLPTIKATRIAFFEALKTNNYNALVSLSNELSNGTKNLVKKKTRTVYEFLDKIIEFYCKKQDLNPHSPENSDEELW